jgi:hypothetical protein
MAVIRNIYKLIDHFSSFTVLPVDPDDVRDQIISYGIKDEIEFVGVTLDTRIIYGAFHQHIRRDGVYAEPVICADIYYDTSLTRDWRRLVCCKELLHILDHSVSKTASKMECENLVTHLADFTLESPFSREKLQAWTDELMMFHAAAVLFPWDARESLYRDYCQDNTRLDEIIKAVDLPESVVRLVLSEGWPNLYNTLSGGK